MPEGTLGIGTADEARATLERSGYVAMWPFLETSLEACLDEFSRSWHLLGGHGVSSPQRLVELTVASACKRRRPYWMALAVAWLVRMASLPHFDARLVSDLLKLAAETEVLPAALRDQARAALAGAGE
ncbi:hypothetical protein ACQPXB_40320 [Amycolatopsis sp. CA-161197]|uniref:hypothetical protein n=1 Tax=unclassified Amycolatopsis TaxID=2618356 RepID=UPI003456B468